jgi:hypothetical protein
VVGLSDLTGFASLRPHAERKPFLMLDFSPLLAPQMG